MTVPSPLGTPELAEVPDVPGSRGPVLLSRFPQGHRAISTAVLGGGIGNANWWINVQVDRDYRRGDPLEHLRTVAARLALTGAGVGMLTAARIDRWTTADDSGVSTVATVGLGLPVLAASADDIDWTAAPGTINLLILVPAPLSDAALVNAVVTATEAKTQALLEAAVPGTGTSSDAVCIVCPVPEDSSRGAVEEYGGPRSRWGSRLARSVHSAVAAGTADWIARHPPGDDNRRWGILSG